MSLPSLRSACLSSPLVALPALTQSLSLPLPLCDAQHSGTPIGSRGLTDLFGLFLFLRLPLFTDSPHPVTAAALEAARAAHEANAARTAAVARMECELAPAEDRLVVSEAALAQATSELNARLDAESDRLQQEQEAAYRERRRELWRALREREELLIRREHSVKQLLAYLYQLPGAIARPPTPSAPGPVAAAAAGPAGTGAAEIAVVDALELGIRAARDAVHDCMIRLRSLIDPGCTRDPVVSQQMRKFQSNLQGIKDAAAAPPDAFAPLMASHHAARPIAAAVFAALSALPPGIDPTAAVPSVERALLSLGAGGGGMVSADAAAAAQAIGTLRETLLSMSPARVRLQGAGWYLRLVEADIAFVLGAADLQVAALATPTAGELADVARSVLSVYDQDAQVLPGLRSEAPPSTAATAAAAAAAAPFPAAAPQGPQRGRGAMGAAAGSAAAAGAGPGVTRSGRKTGRKGAGASAPSAMSDDAAAAGSAGDASAIDLASAEPVLASTAAPVGRYEGYLQAARARLQQQGRLKASPAVPASIWTSHGLPDPDDVASTVMRTVKETSLVRVDIVDNTAAANSSQAEGAGSSDLDPLLTATTHPAWTMFSSLVTMPLGKVRFPP